MSSLVPHLEEIDDDPNTDYIIRWEEYINRIYTIYLNTVVNRRHTFRSHPLRIQFRPETFEKHYAFWHLMQEGRIEEQRTPDMERCRRIRWIEWVLDGANKNDPAVWVFRQSPRRGEQPWALWFYEKKYVVILWERGGYFLLKTAFMVKPHKTSELMRDWHTYQKTEAATLR